MITKAVASEPYQSPLSNAREAPGDGPALLVGTLTVGAAGAPVMGILSGTASWTPGVVADQASASKTVAVAGAAVGDVVQVGVYPALPAGVVASGQVTSGGTVTVTLGNLSGASKTLAAGTVRVAVLQF